MRAILHLLGTAKKRKSCSWKALWETDWWRMDLSKISRLKPSVEIMEELDSAFAAHTFHILGKRLRTMAFLNH